MADGVIRDFLVSLGFDTDNSGLAKMKSAMDGIEWKAKALNGALLTLATGAALAVKQTASELDKLYFSSQRIGASVTNINAYGNAIAQLGIRGISGEDPQLTWLRGANQKPWCKYP